MEDKHSSNHNKHNLLLSGPFNTSNRGINLLVFASSVCQRLTGFLAILCLCFFQRRGPSNELLSHRGYPGDETNGRCKFFASPGAISSRVCLVRWGFFRRNKEPTLHAHSKGLLLLKRGPHAPLYTSLHSSWAQLKAFQCQNRSDHFTRCVSKPKTDFFVRGPSWVLLAVKPPVSSILKI